VITAGLFPAVSMHQKMMALWADEGAALTSRVLLPQCRSGWVRTAALQQS